MPVQTRQRVLSAFAREQTNAAEEQMLPWHLTGDLLCFDPNLISSVPEA
jgi:hypothetical protein